MDLRIENILKEAWNKMTEVKTNKPLYLVFATENSRLGMVYYNNESLFMTLYNEEKDMYVQVCEFQDYDMNTPIEDVVGDYNSNDFCFDKIKYSYKDGQVFEHNKTGKLVYHIG